MYGSYKDLERVGIDIDIMVDLTGGIVVHRNTGLDLLGGEQMDEPDWIGDVFNNMGLAKKNGYPMTCSTPPVKQNDKSLKQLIMLLAFAHSICKELEPTL